MTEDRKFTKPYAIYKPNRKKTGGAVQFQYNKQKNLFFLEAAPQIDEKMFGWKEKKITVKLEMVDLEKLIHTLDGKKSKQKSKDNKVVLGVACSLYHQTDKGNKIIDLRINDQYPGTFYFSVSSKPTGGSPQKVGIAITFEEASGLSIVLKTAFGKLLGW